MQYVISLVDCFAPDGTHEIGIGDRGPAHDYRDADGSIRYIVRSPRNGRKHSLAASDVMPATEPDEPAAVRVLRLDGHCSVSWLPVCSAGCGALWLVAPSGRLHTYPFPDEAHRERERHLRSAHSQEPRPC